ncbi:MAG: phenylalanine--tRNA ligase subunit alpha, partial [Candidatus Acidiferrales bacterium]
MMPGIADKTTKTLEQLGVRSPDQLALLFTELQHSFDRELSVVETDDQWEALRVRWVGRKSGVVNAAKDNWLLKSPSELRREAGKQLNDLKTHVESGLETRRKKGLIKESAATAAGTSRTSASPQVVRATETPDVTLPGLRHRAGVRHILTQTKEEICGIFARLGFSTVEGPEVETDYYNFEALNIPAYHPARDLWDTLYLDHAAGALPDELRGKKSDPNSLLLLRTHTSPMQIRVMEKQPPPVRIVVPGKVYRHDNPDASHSFMFHQVEGLAVDRDITFCDLKGVFDFFLREFFGPKTRTRFVPSYFPFTEPSADIHASCHVCGGSGCRVCKFTGWIEMCGAGMVHPAVYDYVGYDAAEVSG